MFIAHFPTSAWQSNCYLIGPAAGGEVVVVDPGPDAFDVVRAGVAEHGLAPVGVLLTHGHLDHVADAAKVCREYGIPAWVAPEDREMLARPLLGLGEQFAPMLVPMLGGTELPEPDDVRELGGAGTLSLAGLDFGLLRAPGHTRGCTLLRFGDDESDLCLTGDVLFAGSIGRTDLPGGDMGQMQDSLRRLTDWLAPDVVVLPGHGPASTMAAELRGNPYLTSTKEDQA